MERSNEKNTPALLRFVITKADNITVNLFVILLLIGGSISKKLSGENPSEKGNYASSFCSYPSGLNAGNITAVSAFLSWDSIPDAFDYKIGFRISGTDQWTYTASKVYDKGIFGLQEATTYEYKLQTLCTSMDSSSFSPAKTFTTKSLCNEKPVRLYAGSITGSSAILSWSMISFNMGYNIRYRKTASPTWISISSAINSIEINGLTSSTNYEFQVQTNCSSFPEEYSGSFQFSTLADGITSENITITDGNILHSLSNNPVGINMNYLLDDDSYLNPATGVKGALDNLGVKILRFPGGEKADSYMWSTPPWEFSNHLLARSGPFEWPAFDYNFVESDFASLKKHTLNFDEFMQICQSLGAEPLIVVSYDGIFKQATPGGSMPTREQLLIAAEEWVKYANITRGYKIKYWMIGNESYNTNKFSYNGHTTREGYRDDIIEFSARMKAIDPTIKIIANGDKDEWWETLLTGAASSIDILGASEFPVYDFTNGYQYFENNTPNLTYALDRAVNAISNFAPASDKDRIKVIVTEFNCMDWAGSWENTNDLGHGLIAFEVMGNQLINPKVESSLFWTTRWVDHEEMSEISAALDKNGNLTAQGKALAIWGKYLGDQMIATTSTDGTKVFASKNTSTSKLYIYLLNKENKPKKINLEVNGFFANAVGKRWELSGSGPLDKNPIFFERESILLNNSMAQVEVPSVSISVIEFSEEITASLRRIEIDNQNKENWEIRPNPSSGKFSLINTFGNKDLATIKILNSTGKEIYRNVSLKGGSLDNIIDLRDQADGVYFIQVISENKSDWKKIILSR